MWGARPEECGGAHAHTFAKNANVWGTRQVCDGAHWLVVMKNAMRLK